MSKGKMSVWDVPRNDIPAVKKLWDDHDPSKDEWHTLLMLQDDPAELLAQRKTWKRNG